MKATFRTSVAVTVLGILLAASLGSAQEDRAKALLGRWEGAVQWHSGTDPGAAYPNRTLIIESVDQKDGKWVASGKFGITGRGLRKVEIEIHESGASIGIRFVTETHLTARLSLSGTKELTGTLTIPGSSHRLGNDRRFNLQKTD